MKHKIDLNCYTIKEDGIYSNYFNRKLKGHETIDGYVLTRVSCEDGKTHDIYYHIIMWEYFNGMIPDGLQINHKDENKGNNCISNLELMTPKDNINYGSRTEKNIISRNGVGKRTVYQYALDGTLVKTYPSTRKASMETGFCQVNIAKACRGLFKQYKGYRWSYQPL